MNRAKISQAIDALCDAIIVECKPEGGSTDLTELARIANSLAALISASDRCEGKDSESEDRIPKWEPLLADSGHYMVVHNLGSEIAKGGENCE